MTNHINAVAFSIFVVLFAVVTLVGFAAARWRRAEDMLHLNEWGLGGRSFGTFVAWFLLGGDLYTAYTFIAVPAAMFGAGAVTGYFAVAYTIIVFPDRADLPAQALVDRPGAPLRHAGRLHPRPVRIARPRAGHRLHRHPRADALHRAATGGHPGRAHGNGRRDHVGQRLRQGPAAVHRVP